MGVTRPLGFRANAATAGIKPSGKPDLALIVCDVPTEESAAGKIAKAKGHLPVSRLSSAAVFTRNQVVGAPVEIGRAWRKAYLNAHEHGSSMASEGGVGALRAVLVNAGCSNAATGTAGVEDAKLTMRAVSELVGCGVEGVMPSSTGIIGHRLPVEKIVKALPGLVGGLARSKEADEAAAQAIMTTDLTAKSSHRAFELRGHQVHLGAICKGSGMISPSLDVWGNVGPGAGPGSKHGTMLAFITTDAAIEPLCLQEALERACGETFDRVSVDAHPSCSDTVVCMASGHAAMEPIHRNDPEFFAFQRALASLCEEMAMKIVKDGEGATRIFRVEVKGTKTNEEAVRIARAVVDSPLVKCAIHGKDPNWGRIVTAAGNAGVAFDPAEASLTLGGAAGAGNGQGVEVYRHGLPTGVRRDDAKLMEVMRSDPVQALLVVGHGPGKGFMLGCDLSADYVRINADYTT